MWKPCSVDICGCHKTLPLTQPSWDVQSSRTRTEEADGEEPRSRTSLQRNCSSEKLSLYHLHGSETMQNRRLKVSSRSPMPMLAWRRYHTQPSPTSNCSAPSFHKTSLIPPVASECPVHMSRLWQIIVQVQKTQPEHTSMETQIRKGKGLRMSTSSKEEDSYSFLGHQEHVSSREPSVGDPG